MPIVRRCPGDLTRCAVTLALILSAGASPAAAASGHVHPPVQASNRDTVAPGGRLSFRRPKLKRPPVVTATVVQTTASLSNALTAKPSRKFTRTPAPGSDVIAVNSAIRYQRITGFGASMTDSSAWLLYDELTPAARQAALSALFGTQGIHLSFVRIPMAASDFTATGVPYTYDDMPAGQTDPSLANFSITHDQSYIVPALREMLQVNPGVVTMASPWTAPPWMKANHADNDEALAGTVLPQYYPALAQYDVKFIQDYEAEGIPIDELTMMNEPRSLSAWPGTALLPSDAIPFLAQDLEPALQAAGLHPQIYGLDDTEFSDAQTLLHSPIANDLAGTAFHCYQGMKAMSALHAEFPYKHILLSECSPGMIPYPAGEVAIDATRNWAGAVQLWNLALDPSGGPVQPPNYGCRFCTGVITVDEQTHSASYGLNYYQLGQVSRYVQPGAVRIFSNRTVADFAGPTGWGVTRGLDNVAFLNPGDSKVLVVSNNSSTPIPVAVEWQRQYLNWTLAAGAMATFGWH